ncbi:hypothetical protein M0812_11332 [Anaeramoeba flamelloides]|uniref:Uncharacterized protein n=1 Tax=Anaeramoeba flamelloides TaxID=1746091 RepID=A0AAV7ZY78_9EUKA|nr:hypothetical protein M0812_11332 [Anaeramoeba flamelloides]
MKRIFDKKQTKTKDNTPQKPQKNRLRSFHSEPIYKKKQKQKQKTKKQKEKIKKSKALRTLFKGLLKKNKKEKEKEKENKKKVDGKKNEFLESTNPNNLQKLQTIYELKPFIKESLNLNLSSEEHTIPKILDLQQIIAKTFVLFFSPVNLLSNKILKRQNLLSERLPDLAWETTVYQSEIDREVANYQERSDKVTSELKKLRTELGVVKKLLSNTVRRTSKSLLLIQIANNSLDLCKNKRKHTHGDGIKNQKNCYCSYDNESQNMKNSIVWQFDELKQKSNNLRKKSLLAEIPNQRTDLLYYKWQQFEINRLDSFKELYKENTKNYSHQLISEIFEKIDSQNSINEIQIEKAEK